MQRRTVYYSGLVQGVGFRFAARQFAADRAVTGYVRNLPDGRVELVAEGTPPELDQFLASIAQRMEGNIRDTTMQTDLATGEFASFEIRL